jgi:hypothetical protein
MIQPKYSPQEALEKIKLGMKYDLSKTLNENKKSVSKQIVSEQAAGCQNTMEKSEVTEFASIAGNATFQLRTAFARMFNQQESADEILDSVKQIKGKNVIDPTTGECVPAKSLFEKRWKVANKGKYAIANAILHPFSDDDKLTFSQTLKMLIESDYYKGSSYADTQDVIDSLKQALKLYNEDTTPIPPKPEPTPSDTGRQKSINDTYCKNVKDGVIQFGFNKGITWDSWVKKYKVTAQEIETAKNSCGKVNKGGGKTGGGGGGRSRYKQCSETLPIAMYCKNSTIARVQGCIGVTQDGAFGPKTSAALVAKGADGSSITQATVNKVCGGSSPKEIDPETFLPDEFKGQKSTGDSAPAADTNL